MHTNQKFAWRRPLRAGDEVVATLIDGVRARANTAFVTIAVLLATTAGEELCTASSTLLRTLAGRERGGSMSVEVGTELPRLAVHLTRETASAMRGLR